VLGGSVVASAQLSLADPVASHVGFNFMFFIVYFIFYCNCVYPASIALYRINDFDFFICYILQLLNVLSLMNKMMLVMVIILISTQQAITDVDVSHP